MPTVTFRLSQAEREGLERQAAARGVSVSELVREALKLRGSGDPLGDLQEQVADIDRRLSELERRAEQDVY